jgi:hypothetical protein
MVTRARCPQAWSGGFAGDQLPDFRSAAVYEDTKAEVIVNFIAIPARIVIRESSS